MEEEIEETLIETEQSDLPLTGKSKPEAKRKIRLEPLLFLFVAVDSLLNPTLQNLYLDKACHSLKYNVNICENLHEFNDANVAVEELASYYMVYGLFIQKFPSIILAFFIGNFSDKNGRKIVMLLPLFGLIATNLLMFLNTYFRHWTVMGLLLAEIPHGIFGGWSIMLGGFFSYVADTTDKDNKSQKIGIAEIAMNGGCPAGFAVSFFLYRFLKERGILLVSASLQIIMFFVILYGIKETRVRSNKTSSLGIRSFVTELFSCQNVTEAGNIFGNNKGKFERKLIVLILSTHFLMAYSNSGFYSVEYLFLKRRLGWSIVTFSSFETYRTGTALLGVILSVYLFMNKLKLNDLIIGMMAFTSRLVKFILITAAKTGNAAYLAAGLTPMSETCFTVIRSITSKSVSKDEQGKVFLIASLADSITSLLSKIISLSIYKATVANYPTLCLNVLSITLTMCILIFIWLYINKDKSKALQDELDSE